MFPAVDLPTILYKKAVSSHHNGITTYTRNQRATDGSRQPGSNTRERSHTEREHCRGRRSGNPIGIVRIARLHTVLLPDDRSICDCTSTSLGILVWLILSVHLRSGHGFPIMAGYQIVVVYKGLGGVVCEFVLQYDQTGRFWTLTQNIRMSLTLNQRKYNYLRAIFSYCY